jgi:exosortase/archaeosortase
LSRKRKLRFQSLRYLNAVLPYLTPLAWSTLAHAQGTISFNNLTTFMQTVTTACILVGSLAILMGLVFSVFGFIGGNILRGVTGAFGAVLGAGIIGWGPSWVSSLTGQTVGP